MRISVYKPAFGLKHRRADTLFVMGVVGLMSGANRSTVNMPR